MPTVRVSGRLSASKVNVCASTLVPHDAQFPTIDGARNRPALRASV
jgi:hypothetical protein